jgi:hypothetical protein
MAGVLVCGGGWTGVEWGLFPAGTLVGEEALGSVLNRPDSKASCI